MVNHITSGTHLYPDRRSSLGQLIKIIREPQMELVVDKLTEFSSSTDEELRDISGLGIPYYPSFRMLGDTVDSSQDDHC